MKVRIEEMRFRAIEAEAEVPKAMAQEFRYGNPDIYLNIGRMKMKNLDDKKRCCRGGYNHSEFNKLINRKLKEWKLYYLTILTLKFVQLPGQSTTTIGERFR